MASQLVVALQGLVSRERQPLDPAVITVGSFHSGAKHNIISDEAKLQVTVRANSEAERARLIAGIKRVAAGIGTLNGMPADKMPVVNVIEGTPTTINDAPLARRLNATMTRELGADAVVPFEQVGMGAEDFAQFVAPEHGIKGYYFAVGGTPQAAFDAARNGGPPVPSHHSPLFKIAPEPAIVTGTVAMTAAVLDLLGPNGGAVAAGN
jgi:hippurate hydrolase